MSLDLVHHADLLGQIKQRIRQGQSRAVLSANAEMITWGDANFATACGKIGNLRKSATACGTNGRFGKFATACCKKSLGVQHPADGKVKRPGSQSLVHAAGS